MTREHKLALLVGFGLVLVVGILISDHFSKARTAQLNAQLNTESAENFGAVALAEPETLADPIPGGAADPLAAAEPEAPSSLPLDAEGVVLVMGEARPRLGVDEPVGGISSPQYVGGTIEHLGLGMMPAAAQLDDGRQTEPLPPAVTPEPQVAPPPRIVTAAELPLSRGRLISHEVSRGDNLSKLASRYYGDKTLWKPLQGYNTGRVASDGTIRLGATLLIPPKDVLIGEARLAENAKAVPASTLREAETPKETAKAADKKDAKPAPAKPSKPARPASRAYTVKSGDTLLKIAQRQLGTSKRWTEIRELNKSKLDDSDSIRVGMVLALPAE